MAETDKIHFGIEHWRTKARALPNGEIMLAQLESLLQLLRSCEHKKETPISSTHNLCIYCKWLHYTPTHPNGEWEPAGFG